jgi:hypothetical protein
MQKILFLVLGTAFLVGSAHGQGSERLGNLLAQGFQLSTLQPVPPGGELTYFFIAQKESSSYYCQLGIKDGFAAATISSALCVPIKKQN